MKGKRTFTLQLTEEEMQDLYHILASVSQNYNYSLTGQPYYELQGRAYSYWSKVASIMDGEGSL